MPNFEKHLLIGSISGLAVYGVYKYFEKEPVSLAGALIAAGIGAAFAIVPDVIEPAINPNHRSVFHSLAAGGILIETARRCLVSQNLTPDDKKLLSISAAGYLSHLILDAMTPRALPILFE